MSQHALTILNTSSSVPPGAGMDYWGATLPDGGWVWGDGSFYEPSEYPNLFAAFRYTHGQQGRKFKVPDKRSRVSVGAGEGTGLTNRTLGQSFGEESVTLTLAQSPDHIHTVNDQGHGHSFNDPGHAHGVDDPGHAHGVNDPGHAHPIPYSAGAENGSGAFDYGGNPFDGGVSTAGAGTGISIYAAGSNIGIHAAGSNIGIYPARTGITMNSQGGGQSHNNTQPSIACNYIIKT